MTTSVVLPAMYHPCCPAKRMVPAIAVPRDEPRLETHRDSPQISPSWGLREARLHELTDGVSIAPIPSPIRSRPGANAPGFVACVCLD